MIQEEEKQKEQTAKSAEGTQPAPAQLTWYLSCLRAVCGSSGTMQYALGSNQFDHNNSAHQALFKQAVQEHVAANDALNTLYTQQFTAMKKTQCALMTALIKTVQAQLQDGETQLEQIKKDYKTKKQALLQQHEDQFKKNNAALEKILVASLDSSSDALEASSELKRTVEELCDIAQQRKNAHLWLKDTQKVVAEFAPLFALEDKK